MGDGTSIEWTNATWNPVRGCSRVSKGCEHCYAEGVARRFAGPGQPYEGLVRLDRAGRPKAQWNGTVRLVPEHLADPLRWTRPRMVFVNSMSDLFHESLSFEVIAAVFGVMAGSPTHTFQVLTKRPERAREFFAWITEEGESLRTAIGEEPPSGSPVPSACAMFVGRHLNPPKFFMEEALGERGSRLAMRAPWPLPNVWLGVSIEDQRTADERIPVLLETPAAIRWVSYEPALGPVHFHPRWLPPVETCDECGERVRYRNTIPGGNIGDAGAWCACTEEGPEPCDPLRRLDWIVVGGESGPGARPFDLAWARSVIAQGRDAGVPVFVKQLGARPVCGGDRLDLAGARRGASGILSDRKGGDPSEWPEELRVREWPGVSR